MAAFQGIIDQKWGIRHCSKPHVSLIRKERKAILNRIREILQWRIDSSFDFRSAECSDATRSSTYMRLYNQDHFVEM
ncbi:MAG: hypothetical protein KDD64_15130 [Bdellovibrionales bacterium]|nr:hypothetical protein [Bdellovibrionales bacterium]